MSFVLCLQAKPKVPSGRSPESHTLQAFAEFSGTKAAQLQPNYIFVKQAAKRVDPVFRVVGVV